MSLICDEDLVVLWLKYIAMFTSIDLARWEINCPREPNVSKFKDHHHLRKQLKISESVYSQTYNH